MDLRLSPGHDYPWSVVIACGILTVVAALVLCAPFVLATPLP